MFESLTNLEKYGMTGVLIAALFFAVKYLVGEIDKKEQKRESEAKELKEEISNLQTSAFNDVRAQADELRKQLAEMHVKCRELESELKEKELSSEQVRELRDMVKQTNSAMQELSNLVMRALKSSKRNKEVSNV